jgi:hypothetical protein
MVQDDARIRLVHQNGKIHGTEGNEPFSERKHFVFISFTEITCPGCLFRESKQKQTLMANQLILYRKAEQVPFDGKVC